MWPVKLKSYSAEVRINIHCRREILICQRKLHLFSFEAICLDQKLEAFSILNPKT